MSEEKNAPDEIYWSLFQTKEQIRLDGLRLEQVQSVARSLSVSGIKPWFVWYEGISDWQPLELFLPEISRLAVELGFAPIQLPEAEVVLVPGPEKIVEKVITKIVEKVVEKIVEVAPKPVAKPTAKSVLPSDENEKTITRILSEDGRLIPRMQMKLKATVDYRGKLLSTETVDISLGGMKLKETLPFPTAASVIVTLSNGKSELAMKCRVIDPPSTKQKHRLLIETCHRMDLLRQWITPKNS